MSLKNRVVKSATLENMATAEGMPTDATKRFYERLARGGTGLIITGYAYVNKTGQSYPLQNGIYDDAVIPEWRAITDRVHEHGARIAMQIAHGGRQTKAKALGGRQAVAPSAVPEFVYFTRPKALTEPEIWQLVQDFADAAARVKAAGFDAVQIHGAHGYLISSFLSAVTNRRHDDWGGNAEKRLRFAQEVYKSVRQAVGPDFPVLMKLNIKDFVPGGLSPRESFTAAERLAESGLDALEISGGINEVILQMCRGDSPAEIFGRDRSYWAQLYLRSVLAMEKRWARFREAYFLTFAEKLKPRLTIPLILVGGIRRLETAERIVRDGKADFISMARPLIREPGLPNRWLEGSAEAAQCVSCNRCLGEIEQGNILRCYLKAGAAGTA